ncbi:MAG: O-antigen ligase family protein [Anaerostipes sp.]|uniref:O-antigen ligase family protein n=1 Tax=Anaerostipes sp. TaxID=1872530 RepID=UPI0039945F63
MKESGKIDIVVRWAIMFFMVIALIVPAVTTKETTYPTAGYYPRFILNNFFAAVVSILLLVKICFYQEFKNNFLIGVAVLIILGGLYSFFYFQNIDNIGTSWHGWNVMTSLFFLILLMFTDTREIFGEKFLIRFIIIAIIFSSILAIVVYNSGFISMRMENFHLVFKSVKESIFNEKRFNWIYFHKSEYSCVLLLFVGFFARFKKYFGSIFLYIAGQIILFVCLIIAHTNTAIACAIGVLLMDMLDYIFKNRKKIILKLGILSAAGIGIAVTFFKYVAKERDFSSLGSRLPIWKASIATIKKFPKGIGNHFSTWEYDYWVKLPIGSQVNNCHNIFLNEMYRFSIPVGWCYTAMFFWIFLYSIVKKFSFLSLGIWMAFFVVVSMDYTIQTTTLSLVFFMFYCIFFYEPKIEV